MSHLVCVTGIVTAGYLARLAISMRSQVSIHTTRNPSHRLKFTGK